MNMDTSPEIEAMLFERWRQMSFEQKLNQLEKLHRMSRQFALAGILQRHPNASKAEQRWRLMAQMYGENVALRFLGPLAKVEYVDA